MPMTIIPAIDLKNGRCVRLRQGLADEVTVYGDDPVAMAKQWENEGAECLHIVDLDGAFEGKSRHLEVVRRIVGALHIPVELGGGLRTDDDIKDAVDAGVDRVILGTRACEKPEELRRIVEHYGRHLAVGIDARDGMVQTRGWVNTTAITAVDLLRRIAAMGVQTVIYTDTATDGMLGGPNLKSLAAMCDTAPCRIIASGGITTADHIKDLVAMGRGNLIGAIVGKALYEGRVTVAQLKKAACG